MHYTIESHNKALIGNLQCLLLIDLKRDYARYISDYA